MTADREPFDPQDADPLTVPYPGWSRDDLSLPDPEWQPEPVSRGVRRWVVAGIVFVAVLAALVVVTR